MAQVAPGLRPPADGAGDQYDVVAQACAMAIADATAYLRNAEIIATAVVGAAMERLVTGADAGGAQAAIAAAQESVLAAARTLETVAQVATRTLLDFPARSTDAATTPAPPT